MPTYCRDTELEVRVKDTIQSWGLTDVVRPHEITGILIATTAYRHLTDFEARVKVALFTAILFPIDDPDRLSSLSCDTFHNQLCSGTSMVEAGLSMRVQQVLHGMWDHFPRFAAGLILASTLQYINVNLLDYEAKEPFQGTGLLEFVELRRVLSGISEPYF